MRPARSPTTTRRQTSRPTATNLSAAETYVEDTTLNLVDIVASDIDSATVTATLTLSNPAAGSLTTATSGAVTPTYVPATGVWTASGAIGSVNTLLAGVNFVPALNFNASFTIATSVSDDFSPLSVTGSKAVTGTPVNDAPSFTKGADQMLQDAGAQSVSGWATAISAGPANELGHPVDFIITITMPCSASSGDDEDISGRQTDTPCDRQRPDRRQRRRPQWTRAPSRRSRSRSPPSTTPRPTDLSAAETYVEDTTLNLVDIVASDIDSASVTATLTLSNPAAGSLTTATLGAVTSTYVPATGVDRVGCDRQRQHPPGRRELRPGPQLQRQLHDRDQRVRRRPVGERLQGLATGTPVNDAPSFTKGANQTVLDEDAGAQSVSGWATAISAGPTNQSGQTVDFIVSNTNNALFGVQPAVSPTGTLTFTPTANANGSATVSVQIHDNGGVLNGGVDTSAAQTFTITVTAVNDAPTATNLSAAETYVEDTTLNLVDIVASDIDSATVTATLTLSNPAAGSLTTATSGAVTSTYVPATGVWTASGAIANVNTLLAGVSFVPALNFNANFTITTNVSDGALSVSGSKAVTGTPVNDAPVVVITGDFSAADEGTTRTYLYAVTDVDSRRPPSSRAARATRRTSPTPVPTALPARSSTAWALQRSTSRPTTTRRTTTSATTPTWSRSTTWPRS